MTATVSHIHTWAELDQETREELDARFLRELSAWDLRGLTDEGIQVYLRYRHERPDAAITTYEEGQIRRLLRPFRDPARVVDPVAEERHVDRLERFGAERLHATNMETYWTVLAAIFALAGVTMLIVLLL